MLRNRCFLSKILLVFFILSIVLTSAFFLCAVGHKCIGEGCSTCCEMDLIRGSFSNFLVVALLFVFLGGLISFISYFKNIFLFYYRLTPIELRVKISE